jgi:hypothetical protein
MAVAPATKHESVASGRAGTQFPSRIQPDRMAGQRDRMSFLASQVNHWRRLSISIEIIST